MTCYIFLESPEQNLCNGYTMFKVKKVSKVSKVKSFKSKKYQKSES